MKISIVRHDVGFDQNQIKQLESVGDLELHQKVKLTEDEALKILSDTDILISGGSGFEGLGAHFFNNIKYLKYITLFGVGYNRINIDAAKKNNIPVSNARGGNTQAVAEHTRGMILDLGKRITEFHNAAKDHGDVDVFKFTGKEAYQKTIGIIGLGDIGKKIAKIAHVFDMDVLGMSKSNTPIEGVQIAPKKELIQKSDIIVLTTPLNQETYHLISQKEVNDMKDGVILINPAREDLVDKDAILQGLSSGKIYGFGIETDVFKPIDGTHPLFAHPNTIVTPHNARNTQETKKRTMDICISNINSFLAGSPNNLVN